MECIQVIFRIITRVLIFINRYGNLIVMLTDDSNTRAVKKEICELAENDNVYFQEAKYSYAELIDLMSIIEAYCESDEYKNENYIIHGYGIFDNINKVIVYISSDENVVLDKLKTILNNSEAIVYELQEKQMEDSASTFPCGSKITSNNKTFSIGYRAKYTNSSGTVVNGLVTCGHAFASTNSNLVVYQDGTSIGNVSTTKKQYSGKVDAAFVELSSGINLTNKVMSTTTSLSTSVTMNAAAGSTIRLRGYQHLVTGTITSTSFTCNNNTTGVTLSDMVKTNYASISGDSGGVVYYTNSSGSSYVVGIHSRTANDGSYGAYCKASNINSALGISIR